MKRVLFISYLRTPSDKCNSTDIMTHNIIDGLSKCSIELALLIPITENDNEYELINHYKNYASEIYFVKRHFREGQSKYWFIFGNTMRTFYIYDYKRCAVKVLKKYSAPDIIISNKVTMDEVAYGKALSEKYANATFIQYWSDPMTLSGINVQLYISTPRRWIFKGIESAMIRNSNHVIYGTKPLYDTQSTFFDRYSSIMSYVDVSYCESNINDYIAGNNHKVIYAGNYYSTIRDIRPLVEAVSELPNYQLSVYGGGDLIEPTNSNIAFHGRVSRQEIEQVQTQYSIMVVILNKSSTQIPGKLFYDMLLKKRILVIVDGPHKEEISEYLRSFKRFSICENNKEEIKLFLESEMWIDIDYDEIKEKYSPRRVAQQILDGGKKEEY